MTTDSLDVRIERVLDASPEAAWAAWTDPASRVVWYRDQPDHQVDAASDLRVGGAWHVQFGPWREEGVYLELVPPIRLVSTVTFSGPDVAAFTTTLTVTFEADGDKTRFTLVDAGFPNEEIRSAHEGGWPGFVDRFAALLTPG